MFLTEGITLVCNDSCHYKLFDHTNLKSVANTANLYVVLNSTKHYIL